MESCTVNGHGRVWNPPLHPCIADNSWLNPGAADYCRVEKQDNSPILPAELFVILVGSGKCSVPQLCLNLISMAEAAAGPYP